MQLQLSNGRTITITPPTGGKLVRAQVWFGIRFMRLRDHPPADEASQRRAVTKIAKALARYVTGATEAELVGAFLADPNDMPKVAQAVLGGLAYTRKARR